jgi:glycine cleavage system aminomethyltransferase T
VDGEAHACRQACALFDFSFLAIAEIRGQRAVETLSTFIGHELHDLHPGHIRHALRAGDDGMLLSDLTIWNLGNQRCRVMSGIADIEKLRHIPYFGHTWIEAAGIPCLAGRLGYTGEQGFELLFPADGMTHLWNALAGATLGLGYVFPGDARENKRVEDPRGDFQNVRIAAMPYYDRNKKRPRQPWV